MPTIDEALALAADLAPDQTAIWEWDSGRKTSYLELDGWASAIARFLLSKGLKTGQQVGIHLPNSVFFLAAQFGTSRAGGVAALINFRLHAAEATRQLRFGRVGAIVTTAERAKAFRDDPELSRAIMIVADGEPPLGHSITDIVASAGGPRLSAPAGLEDCDAIARFTSGSTGTPKGIVVSHRGWLLRAASLLAEEIRISPCSVTMALGPLAHGANRFVLPNMIRTGTFLVFDRFDIGKAAQALRAVRVSCIQMVPTILQMLLNDAEARDALRCSGVSQIVYGGSPIAAHVIEDALELLPDCDFVQSYGSHEAGSISHLDGPAHRNPALRKSAGRPFLAAALRIARPDPDGIGELEISAPWTPRVRMTEAGREVLTQEWMPTGDLGELRDGYVFLKDRVNDVIISGGYNIYPTELEAVINSHPAVAAAAIVSEPDAKWGERVLAFVVKNSQAVTEEALKDHCRASLASYKVPKEFRFIDAIPLNVNGKPDRRKLSEPLWKGRERRIN